MVLTWKMAGRMLLSILFNSTSTVTIALTVLFIIGEWGLLKKSGLPGWWALIPCAREYQLARCAGREPEGRVTSILSFLHIVVVLLTNLVISDVSIMLLAVIALSIDIGLFFFHVRVFGGLLEVYGVRCGFGQVF